MSGVSSVDRNNVEFLVPKQIYNFLNGANDITRQDGFFDSLCKLVENVSHYDPCSNGDYTLKNAIKDLVTKLGSNKVDFETEVKKDISVKKILETVCIDDAPFMRTVQDNEDDRKKLNSEITQYFDSRFENSYKYLNEKNGDFEKIKNMDINGANFLQEYTNFVDEDGAVVDLNNVVFENIPITGGAYNKNDKKRVRLNLKRENGKIKLFSVLSEKLDDKKINMCRDNGEKLFYETKSKDDVYDTILMPLYNGKTDRYALKKNLQPRCKLQHEGNDISECGSVITAENLDKRHIKAWTPRERGSSASTLNAMSHLRRMASQPRITQVELGSLGPLLARGFMGGSMEGGAQLEVTFSDCPSENKKGDKLSVRQSTQYADLFKSVVQRLGHHNEVSDDVVKQLKKHLEEYRDKECQLFKDAFRLANALKMQNNGSLPDKQPITDLDAFKDASDEVAKSETHLLGCLTKILTEACDK